MCNVITLINQHLKKTINIKKTYFFDNKQKEPILKLVPIETDIREGGRVELECHTGKKNN